MIHTTGTIQLEQNSLNAFSSPKISIVGQSPNKNNGNFVILDLQLYSEDLSQTTTSSISLSLDSVKELMVANSVVGEAFVTNLYTLLEQLLIVYLQTINSEASFEIV